MEFQDWITLINMGLIGAVGYFLKQTMERLNKSEQSGIDNHRNIELVKQENTLKHEYVAKEFGELRECIRELNSTMREMIDSKQK